RRRPVPGPRCGTGAPTSPCPNHGSPHPGLGGVRLCSGTGTVLGPGFFPGPGWAGVLGVERRCGRTGTVRGFLVMCSPPRTKVNSSTQFAEFSDFDEAVMGAVADNQDAHNTMRSEERRVGKERRA